MSEAEQQQSSNTSDGGNGAPPQKPQLAPIFPGRSNERSRDPNDNEMPQLKFPPIVLAEVQTAIRTYTPDSKSGHYRAQLQGRNPSVITYWGVRLETTSKERFKVVDQKRMAPRPQLLVCLADKKCRNNGTVIKITSQQTSSATTIY